MTRKEYLATKIGFLLKYAEDHKMSRADTAVFLVEGFEDHYSELPMPPSAGDMPDREWVETLWKMAEERKNTNSSFPAMCKFVLNAMDYVDITKDLLEAAECENTPCPWCSGRISRAKDVDKHDTYCKVAEVRKHLNTH